MQKRWPTIVVPVMHGCVLMLPILLGGLLRPHDETFASSIWVTAFSIELVLYAIGTVFVIFMLVSDRAVTVHKTAASVDPLSGMFNRRGFSEACTRVIEREADAGRPVTVMIFDIDHFKCINDRFGHPAGDEILKLFSTVVVSNLRISDLSGRIGGEEFAALLPCSLEEGVIVAERVREAFEASGIVCEEGPVDTTVSIGVAGGPAGTELEVLLAAADTALYQAKRSGRNRVEAAEELPLSLENWRRKTAGASRAGAARSPAQPATSHESAQDGAAVTSRLPFRPYHLRHGFDPQTKPAGRPDVARSGSSLGPRRFCLHVLDLGRIRDGADHGASCAGALRSAQNALACHPVHRLRADGRRHGAAVQLSCEP